jgi:hypothetical protein
MSFFSHLVRRRLRIAAPILGTLAALAILAPAASAQSVQPYAFSFSFDGALSSVGPIGGNITDVAVNEVSGRVYALHYVNGSWYLDQFDANGNPVPFSALKGSSSIRLAIASEEGGPVMTVDNTGGAAQGRILISSPGTPEGQIVAYNPDGTPAGAPFPIEGHPFGLAINPLTHELWSDQHYGAQGLARYTSEYAQTTTFYSLDEQIAYRIAIDPEGNFYVNQWRGTTKYNEAGKYLYSLEYTGAFPTRTAVAVDQQTDDVFTLEEKEGVWRVAEFNSRGTRIGIFGAGSIGQPGTSSSGITVNGADGTVYVGDQANQRVDVFKVGPAVVLPEALPAPPTEVEPTSVRMTATVDPAGQATTKCAFIWGVENLTYYGSEKEVKGEVPCTQGNVLTGSGAQVVSAPLGGLTKGATYFYRLAVENTNGPVASRDEPFSPSDAPAISAIYATDVHSDTATLHGTVNPGGGRTTYYFEYGTQPCLEGLGGCATTPVQNAGRGLTDVVETEFISHLTPGATYYYRLVATNAAGTRRGVERTIHVFGAGTAPIEGCPNAHERQQTGAATLLDCRAYELVSAADTGGYDVESTLVPTQTPFLSYPDASGRVLYGTEGGGVPNVGYPTNNGLDPYLATRTPNGWVTSYIGIPSNDPYAAGSFSSTLSEGSANLGSAAFGGPGICSPCFADGSSGIPVRLPNGELVQGMVGSIPHPDAVPSGYIGRALSADGSDLVFGTTSQLEPGGNTNGDVTVYERDLTAGRTEVVSTLPGGTTMTGTTIGELGLSDDGTRAVVGQGLGTDVDGNTLWRPYMHFAGSPNSVDLAPGGTSGVYFDGMSADGSRVFFTTVDKLLPADTDNAADIYEATVTGPGAPATLRLVSVGSSGGNGTTCTPAENWNVPSGGPNCGAVAIGGGAGVSADGGSIYFLSPELLDGTAGVADQPNLYVSRGGGPAHFVATLDSDTEGPITDPTVLDAVAETETHHYADFQVSPDGSYAAFPSAEPLTGYASEGELEVYRYAAAGSPALTCVSCAPTNAKSEGGSSLPERGLGLTGDGSVFFSTNNALVVADLNKLRDAYEWENGTTQLISTGASSSPSALFGVSADGTDAFFFTREQLAPQDGTGNHVKIYDARAGGGFAYVPPPVPCKAADECHGPSSVPAPSPPINTVGGAGGNQAPVVPAKKCKKGKALKKGKCVAKPHPKHHKKKTKKKNAKKGNHHG